MLRIGCALTLLLLGITVLAAGEANALLPPGETVCKGMRFMWDGDGPDPFLVLFAGFGVANAVLDVPGSLTLPAEASNDATNATMDGVPGADLPTASDDRICVHWLNVCGPVGNAVLERIE